MLSGTELIRDMNDCVLRNGQGALWWLGQHGFAIKLGQAVFYIDAFLTPMKPRNVPPLLRPDDLTNASAILGTHDHIDHIDRPCWPGMAAASPQAKLIVPKHAHGALLKDGKLPGDRLIGLDAGQSVEVAGVKISAIPAAHELLHRDPATGEYPFLGYILEGNGRCVYHAGDTCLYEGMHDWLRRWKIDVALLPINGRDAARYSRNCLGNMTFQEAADLAGAIEPGLTIPTHFEMFTGNSENPQLFIDYMSVKWKNQKTAIPVHGNKMLF